MSVLEKIDEHLLLEANKGGLFDEYSKFNAMLMKKMEKVLTAKLKKGAFKTTWRERNLTSGYAFSMKGYNSSDHETEIMVNFWVKGFMPHVYRIVLNLKTPDSLNNDIYDKEEGFAEYNPNRFAEIFSQYVGFGR